MVSLQSSALLNPLSSSCSSYSSSLRRIKCAFNVPKLPRISVYVPKALMRNMVEEINRFSDESPLENNHNMLLEGDDDGDDNHFNSTNSKAITTQLYAILEAVADRVEMHNNVAEQRDNWNTLLLNSINMITLTASTMAGVAGVGSEKPFLALKLSSALLFSAATGMLLLMNKIQPSQLAEEQRKATRLFKELKFNIETALAIGNPSEEDVKCAMEKILALDKAYPLPLLGAMLEKFPAKFEPARWWPSQQRIGTFNNEKQNMEIKNKNSNGWNVELEKEMKEVIEVVKRKDKEDFERLGNLALKINKALAISGPLLTGIAAFGSVFAGEGSWGALVPVLAGSLATVVNSFEHGGQIGMVFEMYRNCGGFFQLLEETIEATIEEKDLEKRENGEVFEMKMALQLGRSVSELRELTSKSASYRVEGREIDEFASKLF